MYSSSRISIIDPQSLGEETSEGITMLTDIDTLLEEVRVNVLNILLGFIYSKDVLLDR